MLTTCVLCVWEVQHALSAFEEADCKHCERLPLHTLQSRCHFLRKVIRLEFFMALDLLLPLSVYLSPGSASSLKAPKLPTKPLTTTSALVGKAYMAAGQAGACLHTMSVLQAYQADLLGTWMVARGLGLELHQATCLSGPPRRPPE